MRGVRRVEDEARDVGNRWLAILVRALLLLRSLLTTAVAVASQLLTAKPNAVCTDSRLSGITEGFVRHDPVAMASAAGGIVGL